MPGRKAHHAAGMAIKCQIRSEKKRLYPSPNCVLSPVMKSGSVKMFNLASPCCVQRWSVTYWELFLGILPPNWKQPTSSQPPAEDKTWHLLFSCSFSGTSAEGEHVQQGGGGRPRRTHHHCLHPPPMISPPPRCHQTTGGEGRWRLWQEDNRSRDAQKVAAAEHRVFAAPGAQSEAESQKTERFERKLANSGESVHSKWLYGKSTWILWWEQRCQWPLWLVIYHIIMKPDMNLR